MQGDKQHPAGVDFAVLWPGYALVFLTFCRDLTVLQASPNTNRSKNTQGDNDTAEDNTRRSLHTAFTGILFLLPSLLQRFFII